jgi:hypothetical protein
VIDRGGWCDYLGMNCNALAPFTLALGLLVSACDTPPTDESNDEQGTETTDESGDETDDTESSSDDAESTTGDGLECECIPEQADNEQPMPPSCGEPLCDIVSEEDGFEGVPTLATPEALECALTALRDRTPGYVRWGSVFNGGQFSEHGYVLIYANGEAVHREWGAQDLSYVVEPARRFELPDPSHYEACLANADDHERYYCLRQIPIPSIEECEAGWSESDT